ncbi:MAG: DUF4235 domain-containing protein [Propionibacteriaceae bacterium]|jgi:hypothetical protein|nr:DUF4235 domain-containing protein [Propionibacteriaceae bacterium]
MDRVILNKIYAGLISAAVTLVAGFGVKKMWGLLTGGEPPNPEDPDVPVRHAVGWFMISGVGIGLAQLLFQRSISRRVKAHSYSDRRID